MEFSKKDIIVFSIEKTKGIVYTTADTAPITIDFPTDTVNHLEVVDKEKLHTLITTSLEAHDLKPSPVILLLTPEVTFEKDMEDASPSLRYAERENFLDMVPFHRILSKVYKINKKTKVVAANRELCEVLTAAFEQKTFAVTGLLPATILADVLQQSNTDRDPKMIARKIDVLKQYSLLETHETRNMHLTTEKPKITSTRFLLLIGTFAVLLLIFAVLLFSQLHR